MVFGVAESMAYGPMVSVNGREGMGIRGTWVCIVACFVVYWAVKLVHSLSGQ